MDERAPVIVLLPPKLRRELDRYIESSTAYEDISDFLGAAARNQLALDTHARGGASAPRDASAPEGRDQYDITPRHDAGAISVGDELLQPIDDHQQIPSGAVTQAGHELPFLSNRMYIFPVVARMIGWLTITDNNDYPTFVDAVTTSARALGLRLRDEDRRHRRSALQRRSVGWPLGDEVEKSRDRFMFGYGIEANGLGPLRTLGLADVSDGRVVMSELATALARADVPILGEGPGDETVSEEARTLLGDALLKVPTEVSEMACLFRALGDGASQDAVDAALATEHQSWSPGLVASQRAALLGRLRDLGVMTVEGRGPSALVSVRPQGDAFVKRVLEVDELNGGRGR